MPLLGRLRSVFVPVCGRQSPKNRASAHRFRNLKSIYLTPSIRIRFSVKISKCGIRTKQKSVPCFVSTSHGSLPRKFWFLWRCKKKICVVNHGAGAAGDRDFLNSIYSMAPCCSIAGVDPCRSAAVPFVASRSHFCLKSTKAAQKNRHVVYPQHVGFCSQRDPRTRRLPVANFH